MELTDSFCSMSLKACSGDTFFRLLLDFPPPDVGGNSLTSPARVTIAELSSLGTEP
jgi:hypothetical protein